jgi:hypothetical protein
MNKLPKDVQHLIYRYLHRDKIDKTLHFELIKRTKSVYHDLQLHKFDERFLYISSIVRCCGCKNWEIRESSVMTFKKPKKPKKPKTSKTIKSVCCAYVVYGIRTLFEFQIKPIFE